MPLIEFLNNLVKFFDHEHGKATNCYIGASQKYVVDSQFPAFFDATHKKMLW
jgi:hypothetical protein